MAEELEIYNRRRRGEIEEELRRGAAEDAESQRRIEEAEETMREALEALKAAGAGPAEGGEEERETGEARTVEKEIENMPEEKRRSLLDGLSLLGFAVEQKKNNFFASTFDHIIKKTNPSGKIAEAGKTKTTIEEVARMTSRFCEQLRDSFARDSENAKKKSEDITSGKEKHKIAGTGRLFGNIVRYGRMITDITRVSLTSPLRYVMMGGMIFTRASEAAKEARLKNEEVMEKTRIQDADQAAEEAWGIYKRAKREKVEEGKDVSTEALKSAYLDLLPDDIKRRLENPSTGYNFLQKILRFDMESGIFLITKEIERVDNNEKLSPAQKEEAITKITKRYEKGLKDYDRMLTQYGTVDALAMAGRYAQTAGKAVVGVVTLETLFLSVEKMWGALSHILSSHHDVHEAISTAGGAKPVPSETTALHHPETTTGAGPETHTPAATHETPAPTQETPPATPPEAIQLTAPVATEPAHIATPPPPTMEPTPPSAPSVVASDLHESSITFNHGKGGIQGILDLKAQIRHDYPDISKAPQSVQDFMHTDATKEAIRLGLFDPSAADGKESALIGEGSVLKLDVHGNISLHDTLTGKDNILVHGDTSQVEHYGGKMFHSGHPGGTEKIPETPTERNYTPVRNFTPVRDYTPIESTSPAPESAYTGESPPAPKAPILPLENATPESAPAPKPTTIEEARSSVLDAYGQPKVEAVISANRGAYGGNIPYGTTSGAYGTNLGGPGEIREHAQHFFPGLSGNQNLILNTHPEFAHNPFNLTGPRLMEVYEIHQRNLNQVFSYHDHGIEAWNDMKDLKVSNLIKTKDPDPGDRLTGYVQKLYNLTKQLRPEGGVIRKPETTEHYIARALQWLAKNKKLNQLKVE